MNVLLNNKGITVENSLFIRALNRQTHDRTPVWLMRQAGRYLPEYREIRNKVKDFWELCQTPELACEVTLQPLRRYALDAAIVFSDILTIPHAMGFSLAFQEKKGPVFEKVFDHEHALKDIQLENIHEHLSYVYETVAMVRKNMPQDIPLIGFAGSPWTLACYMIEGQSSREFDKVFAMMYRHPVLLKGLLSCLATVISEYLIRQAQAGAQALMIFDTWGGLLPADSILPFNLMHTEQIIQNVRAVCPNTPIIMFSKGCGFWLPQMSHLGCQALGVDWTVDLSVARHMVDDRVCLQGNLHPKVLLQSHDVIRREVQQVIAGYGHGWGHVFNLGHGITPDVPPDAVKVIIDAVYDFSRPYKK
jgi:uroporphyrinogen decarboxylase